MKNSFSLKSVIASSHQRLQPVRKAHGSFKIIGILERGLNTRFAIDGVDVWVSENTWVIGVPQLGQPAAITGPILPDGRHAAMRIIVQ